MPSLDENINTDTNRQHYNSIADAWPYLLGQNFHWGLFQNPGDDLDAATDRLIDLMIDRIPLNEKTHLLDVGCGIGGPARYIAKRTKSLVTGFSTSPEGIDRAARFVSGEENPALLNFEVRDALDNGFPDETFSAAILLEMSHLIRDKHRLIQETGRAVQIGGSVALCDLTLRRRLSAREIVDRQNEIRLLETCFGKARLEPLDTYQPFFEANGFTEIKTRDLSSEVFPTIRHWKANAESNANELLKYLSEEHLQNFIESCDTLTDFFLTDVWGYGLISGVKTSKVSVKASAEYDGQRLF